MEESQEDDDELPSLVQLPSKSPLIGTTNSISTVKLPVPTTVLGPVPVLVTPPATGCPNHPPYGRSVRASATCVMGTPAGKSAKKGIEISKNALFIDRHFNS